MEGFHHHSQPVMHTLKDRGDDAAAAIPSRSSSRSSLSGMGAARRSEANLRTVRDDKSGGMKRIRSSDMLRMQMDMMQSESAEQKAKADADLADQKAKADADLATVKRQHDADKDYMRNRINELRKQVADAEKAKAMVDAKLETSLNSHAAGHGDGSNRSGDSTSEEEQRLQKQVEDGAAERKVLEDRISKMKRDMEVTARRRSMEMEQAKQEGREEMAGSSSGSNSAAESARVAALQKELEELAAAKKMADDELDQRAMADGIHHAAMDAASSKERRLKKKLQMLQDEMELAAYEKKVSDDKREEEKRAAEQQKKAAEDKLRAQLRKLQLDMDLAVEEKEALVEEKEALVEEKEALVEEKEALVEEKEALVEEKEALVEEKEVLVEEKEALVEEKEVLEEEKDAAVKAKADAEKELQRATSDSASSASRVSGDAEQISQLQKQLEDLRAQKLAHDRAGAAEARGLKWELAQARSKGKHDADAAQDAKEKLEAQLAEMQEAADEAAYSKLAGDDAKAELERQLKEAQGEMEQLKLEVSSGEGTSQDSSQTDELIAKLKASENQVKKLLDEKETATLSSDGSDKELADLKEQLRQLEASKKNIQEKAAVDVAAAAARERHTRRETADMANVLAGLERKLEESKEAEAAMKAKADLERDAKLKAESDLKAELSSDNNEELKELKKQLAHMTDAKAVADSQFESLLERTSDGSTLDDRLALLGKELYDSRIAGMAQKRSAGAKEAELENQLASIKEELDAAVHAKLYAEKERDWAQSEATTTVVSDEKSAELQRKLEEMEAAKKAGDDAKEKLGDDLDALKAKLTMLQEEADEAAYAKLEHETKADAEKKAIKIAADARESDLKRQLRDMKRQKEKAEFQKSMADGEVERLKNTSNSDASSNSAEMEALAKKLKNSKDKNAEDKEALKEMKKKLDAMADAKSVADSELASLLERTSDGSSSDERIALLRKELYDSRVSGMAQKRSAGAKEAELENQLKAIKEEMEAAVDAKIVAEEAQLVAEKELDRAQSDNSSSMASDERSAQLQSQLAALKAAKKASDDAAEDREKKLEEDVQRIKASRQARIDASEARERKLGDDIDALKAKLTTMQEDADEAAYAKLEHDTKADARLSAAKDAADAMESKLRRQLRDMKRQKEKAEFDKSMADGEVERLKNSSNSESSANNSAEVDVLNQKLRESEKRIEHLRASKKTAQDNAAAKQKVDKDDRDALQAVLDSLKLQLDESKDDRKAEVDQLQEKLRALQGRVETAEHAQDLAEQELDNALADSSSGGGSAADAKVSMLRKELYDNRLKIKAQKDAGAEREKKLADQLEALKEEAEQAAKATEDEFLAKEGDLMKRVKFLQEEMELAMEAKYEAEKERDQAQSLSDKESSNSSSAADSQAVASLQKQLEKLEAQKKAADNAGAAREAELEAAVQDEKDAGASREAKLGATIDALRTQLQTIADAADEAAYDKTAAAGRHKADMDAAGAREDELKRKLKDAVNQKDVAEEKLEKMSSDTASSNAGGGASAEEVEALKSEIKALKEKAEKDMIDMQEQAEEEKKWADESIQRLQEELSLLQEQAAVLASGKRVAEEEIREMKNATEDGKDLLGEVADELLVQQVEQLKAEQQLSYNIAETMYRRLDADNQALQEELEALETKKKEVDDELLYIKEHVLVEMQSNLHNEQSERAALQVKMREEKAPQSKQEDLNNMKAQKEQIDKLLRDLEHVTAEKEAATKRLEWEKATKRELRQKIFGLQEHADTASTAKKALEEELKALQDQPETQTTASMEELAEKLKNQVESLQEEKEETLRKMQALEHAVATGEYEVGDSARVRETYINKLQSDIELLETSVKHLTDENKVLLDSKERLQGEMGKGDKAKFCALDDQIKSLNSQTKELTEKLDAARKEAGDAKVAQKEEKDQVLDLQARMDKNILQLATLKSSTRMNMERIKKEHEDAVKSAKESGAAEVREELDELHREREALKAALEVETQGRKNDEKSRAEKYAKDARLSDAKDEKIAALERQVREEKKQAEEMLKRNKELETQLDRARKVEEFAEEKKEAVSTPDEFFRMKSMFEKQIKEMLANNEELARENEELRNQSKENGSNERSAANFAVGTNREDKLVVLETENASLKEQMRSERQNLEHQIRALQSQLQNRNTAATEPNRSNGVGGSSTDLVAASSAENLRSISTHHLQQGPLAAMKASRDRLLTRLSRNLHNERDSLARRAQALKLSTAAAERAAGSAALTTSNPGLIERSMRDMAHSQEEFESLQSILNHYKSLYEMKDLALKETQIERDELRLELQRSQGQALE